MIQALEMIQTNLGMSVSIIIFLVLLIANMIIFAKDFKIGIMLMFLINGSLFMWFYALQWNFLYPLIVMCMSIAIMSLILLATSRRTGNTGII